MTSFEVPGLTFVATAPANAAIGGVDEQKTKETWAEEWWASGMEI